MGVYIEQDIPVQVAFENDFSAVEFRLFPIGIPVGGKGDPGGLLATEENGLHPGSLLEGFQLVRRLCPCRTGRKEKQGNGAKSYEYQLFH
jgi:hypothetical protein